MTLDSIKLLSFNAKGLQDTSKRLSLFTWCIEQKADIILLQETHSTSKSKKQWCKDWGGPIYFSHGTSGARGVAILILKKLKYKVLGDNNDKNGRILVLDIKINNLRFTLVNLYAPNNDTPEFFVEVEQIMNIYENDTKIIGGDFNLVLNILLDKKGGRPKTHEHCRKHVVKMMEDYDLYDVWRREHPTEFGYTWKSYKQPHIYCRLDFFLITFNLVGLNRYNKILPGFQSDHNAVTIPLTLDSHKKGPGFWKLNCSLLSDEQYKTRIVKCINECILENPNTEDGLLWETIKCRVRGSSIKYSAEIKRNKNKNILELENELIKLKQEVVDSDNPNVINDSIKEVEDKLEKYIKEKTMGNILRSKSQYYELGEKSTRYFHNLEKRNQENKHIKMLIT